LDNRVVKEMAAAHAQSQKHVWTAPAPVDGAEDDGDERDSDPIRMARASRLIETAGLGCIDWDGSIRRPLNWGGSIETVRLEQRN
jgi:hypothetical protein